MCKPVEWIDERTSKPDADQIVLVTVTEGSSDPVWLGYWDDAEDVWRAADGGCITVTAWAELPEPFETEAA